MQQQKIENTKNIQLQTTKPTEQSKKGKKGTMKTDADKRAIHLTNKVFEKFEKLKAKAEAEMDLLRKKVPGEKLGRTISYDDVAAAAIELADESKATEMIKNRCLRPSDKKFINYIDYCKNNEDITWDDYVVMATESLAANHRN